MYSFLCSHYIAPYETALLSGVWSITFSLYVYLNFVEHLTYIFFYVQLKAERQQGKSPLSLELQYLLLQQF